MYTYDVTIVRNVGDAPMTDVSWHVFQFDVLDLLVTYAERHTSVVPEEYAVEQWTGEGRWGGMAEDSSHFQLRTTTPLSDEMLGDLKRALAFKADEFKQEAVAFSIGECFLVKAIDLAEAHRQARERVERARSIAAQPRW